MSRVGKMPVTIPAGVDVSIKEDQISVSELAAHLPPLLACWSKSTMTTVR